MHANEPDSMGGLPSVGRGAELSVWEQIRAPGWLRSWVVFAGAVVFRIAIFFWNEWLVPGRSVLDRGQPPSQGSAWFVWTLRVVYIERRIFDVLESWPWILIVFSGLAVWAVWKRNAKNGWAVAFFAGEFFSVLLERIFSKI